MSPDWTNNANALAEFFLEPELLPRLSMGNLNGWLLIKGELDPAQLNVLPADEYERARTSPKLLLEPPTRVIPYPDGSPGFYFLRMRYADDIDAQFAADRRDHFARPAGRAAHRSPAAGRSAGRGDAAGGDHRPGAADRAAHPRPRAGAAVEDGPGEAPRTHEARHLLGPQPHPHLQPALRAAAAHPVRDPGWTDGPFSGLPRRQPPRTLLLG
jgi:hypothetical protein